MLRNRRSFSILRRTQVQQDVANERSNHRKPKEVAAYEKLIV